MPNYIGYLKKVKTMAKQLNIEARNKLKKLIPMLASDKDGEVIAAVGAIRRTLQSNESDFHDLAAKLSKQQRQAIPLAIIPDITINGKAATVDSIKKLVIAFNKMQKENNDLKEKVYNLQVEIDELEEANENELKIDSKPIKPLGHKIVEEAFERMGSIIVFLF